MTEKPKTPDHKPAKGQIIADESVAKSDFVPDDRNDIRHLNTNHFPNREKK